MSLPGFKIIDPKSPGSWCIKGTDNSFLRVDSSVRRMHRDPSNLRSSILIRMFKTRTHPQMCSYNCIIHQRVVGCCFSIKLEKRIKREAGYGSELHCELTVNFKATTL